MARKHPAQGQANAQDVVASAMSEDELLFNVRDCAQKLGWLFYHTRDSRKSDEGFPDCHMVRDVPEREIVYAELKAQKGKLREEQNAWLRVLTAISEDEGGVQVRYYIWRPEDWLNGRIEKALR